MTQNNTNHGRKAQPIGNTDELDRLFERMIAEAAAHDKKAVDSAP